MKQAVRQTRSHLMELFSQHGFHPRVDLGQNFLIDLNLVEYIARKAELSAHDVVLEIGAGTGGLTTYLAAEAGEVISVEIDDNMHRIAAAVTEPYANVTLLKIDALKNKNHFAPALLETVGEKLAPDWQRRLKLVANLPYNIATPVISNLVATEWNWERMVVTIQWELAERMTASPGEEAYGALSVWLQSQCRVNILKKLPPTVFWPRPKVHSAILRIDPLPDKRDRIADRAFFHDFLRRLFHHRRKFARKVLCGMYRKQLSKPQVDAVLAEQGYKTDIRAEQLDVPALVELSNRLQQAIRSSTEKTVTNEPR